MVKTRNQTPCEHKRITICCTCFCSPVKRCEKDFHIHKTFYHNTIFESCNGYHLELLDKGYRTHGDVLCNQTCNIKHRWMLKSLPYSLKHFYVSSLVIIKLIILINNGHPNSGNTFNNGQNVSSQM